MSHHADRDDDWATFDPSGPTVPATDRWPKLPPLPAARPVPRWRRMLWHLIGRRS